MAGKVYGYIAALKDAAEPPIQDRIAALEAREIDRSRIVIERIEKKRGQKAARPRLQRLISQLRPGDTLTVESVDCLGFGYADLSDSMELLSEKEGVILDILDLPLLHEVNINKTYFLLRPFLSDLVIESFRYLARRQKDIRDIQQRKGLDKALSMGVRVGRRRADVSEDFQEIAKKWQAGGITSQEAAKELGLSRSTFFRRAKENGFFYKSRTKKRETEDELSAVEQDDAKQSNGACP